MEKKHILKTDAGKGYFAYFYREDGLKMKWGGDREKARRFSSEQEMATFVIDTWGYIPSQFVFDTV